MWLPIRLDIRIRRCQRVDFFLDATTDFKHDWCGPWAYQHLSGSQRKVDGLPQVAIAVGEGAHGEDESLMANMQQSVFGCSNFFWQHIQDIQYCECYAVYIFG